MFVRRLKAIESNLENSSKAVLGRDYLMLDSFEILSVVKTHKIKKEYHIGLLCRCPYGNLLVYDWCENCHWRSDLTFSGLRFHIHFE